MNSPQNPQKQQIAEESKTATIKVLAIVGSLAVIIIGVWLAVQIVRVLPNAFSSLASIADDVYRGDSTASDTFEVSTNKSSIESGETFTLSWKDTWLEGTYRFRYECIDGVSVAVRVAGTGTVEYIECNEIFSFTDSVTSLEVFLESEKYRTADIAYTITFIEAGVDELFGEHIGTITVTNPEIADGDTGVLTEDSTITDEVVDDVEEPTEPVPTTPATPKKPVQKMVYIPYVPISLDNGYTDLKATVVGIGYVKGKTFYPSLTIDNDDDAAIQIEVRNIGTKTSEEWDIDIELPNGEDYSRDNRKSLKPNEREIITIVFEAKDETGFEEFDGKISVDNDTDRTNNNFGGVMQFVN